MSNKICTDKKGVDKQLHFLVSFLMGVMLFVLSMLIKMPLSIWYAALIFAIVMLIGVAKELYDRTQPNNHFCVWDLLYDGMGATASVIVCLIGYCILH